MIIIYLLILIIILLLILLYNKNKIIDTFNIYKRNIINYCIYMPNRKEYITTFLKKYNLNTRLINAIPKDSLQSYKTLNPIIQISLGQLACYLSHLMVYNIFLKSNYDYCIIFEDDLDTNLSPNKLNTELNNNINYMPNDIDILFLGYCYEYCDKIVKINPYMGKSIKPLCTHAYLLSKPGVKKLIDLLIPKKKAIDVDILNLIIQNKLNCYSSLPYLFKQKERLQIIQNINPGKSFNLKYCI